MSLNEKATGSILRYPQKSSQADSAEFALRSTQKPPDNGGMKVGSAIRKRRKALKLTLEQVVDRIEQVGGKTDTGNLSRIETGKQGAVEEMLRLIAQALGCSVVDFFAAEGPAAGNIEPAPLGTRRIPLIDYVQAGHMAEVCNPYTVGDASEWLMTESELSANAFALRIKGDSMLPDFTEGDVVIVDPAVNPYPGSFVVAKNGENEATFKKYRPRGINERGVDVFELVPLNDDYPSIRSDLVAVNIIGTMVEHRRFFRRR